ncbi:hypothetical protein AB0I81_22865 [Nonomuraea sp. NPDC050404]|uniref:hypothetical protein n=1 Tax=Nonomuraea sp. NPDC050404 TaxID=3155783 RepID=UPI0033F70D90
MIITVRQHEGAARPDSNWTLSDAAALLNPELTADQVRAMIELFAIEPNGKRLTGRRGKPLPTYDPDLIQRAHAILVRARVDLGAIGAA